MKEVKVSYHPAWLTKSNKIAKDLPTKKTRQVTLTISVKNLQSKAVEPDNFYKPISKIF